MGDDSKEIQEEQTQTAENDQIDSHDTDMEETANDAINNDNDKIIESVETEEIQKASDEQNGSNEMSNGKDKPIEGSGYAMQINLNASNANKTIKVKEVRQMIQSEIAKTLDNQAFDAQNVKGWIRS